MSDEAPARGRSIEDAVRAAKRAAGVLASVPTEKKDAVLRGVAARVRAASDALLAANAEDMERARAADIGQAKLKRLELTPAGLEQMATGLEQLASMPDPVGSVTRDDTVESGLRVKKVRAPLGVVAMIYEARPGVTVDAFALCFKAGNACLLKGGREAASSNAALESIVRAALAGEGIPEDAISLVTTSDREEIKSMLGLTGLIDLVIPRGGKTLIEFVHEHARVPTVQHFEGVCHAYVDASADLNKALEIVVTAKVSAPATCNALECVLIDRAVAPRFIPALAKRLEAEHVELRGDPGVLEHAPDAAVATEDDWGAEFLDYILAARVVDGLDGAVEHIGQHASDHTECVVAQDRAVQEAFCARVTSSCVMVNASTRFNDGFQLGLGAEIGISTSRIHAYGPMGLEELTTQRWVVEGSGQVR